MEKQEVKEVNEEKEEKEKEMEMEMEGAGSREKGSREQGAGSGERGAGSRQQAAGSRQHGAGSREQGAGSREQGAGEGRRAKGEGRGEDDDDMPFKSGLSLYHSHLDHTTLCSLHLKQTFLTNHLSRSAHHNRPASPSVRHPQTFSSV